MSETARVRFLETRVVDDAFKGTARESRFEAGGVYELPVRSADRWVKRGAAVFNTVEDETKAIGASSNVSLAMLDSEREQVTADGAVRPVAMPSIPSADDASSGSERSAIVERIAVGAVAGRLGMTREAFAELPLEHQLEHLLDADAEIMAHFAGPTADEALDQRTGGPVTGAGSDTDGDQLGDVEAAAPTAPTGGGDGAAGSGTASSTDAAPEARRYTGGSGAKTEAIDFDSMTDEHLREFIDKRDGKRPRRDASRETLLAKAKEGAEG